MGDPVDGVYRIHTKGNAIDNDVGQSLCRVPDPVRRVRLERADAGVTRPLARFRSRSTTHYVRQQCQAPTGTLSWCSGDQRSGNGCGTRR